MKLAPIHPNHTFKPVFQKTRHSISAVWMRAGTSKGLYIHRRHLPPRQADWAPIITRLLGSHDSDPHQLDGIGGATSTTSKVAVVSKSQRANVDVEYTFIQCSIGSPLLDFTGNCGNIASGVAPFAVDEGLVDAGEWASEVSVRIFNTNTQSMLISTVPVDSTGHFLEDGDCKIPGVMSQGSAIRMTLVNPAGAMTGSLLPSGAPVDILPVQNPPSGSPFHVVVSAVDAANPFLFVDGSTIPQLYHKMGLTSQHSLVMLETIRRRGAVLMGLARDENQASLIRGTPKIAVLPSRETPDGRIEVISFSMGKVHSSLQLTGAVCLASAACIEGTIAYNLIHAGSPRRSSLCYRDSKDVFDEQDVRTIAIRHPGGDMDVEVRLGLGGHIENVTVFRTARRLFAGKAYYIM